MKLKHYTKFYSFVLNAMTKFSKYIFPGLGI